MFNKEWLEKRMFKLDSYAWRTTKRSKSYGQYTNLVEIRHRKKPKLDYMKVQLAKMALFFIFFYEHDSWHKPNNTNWNHFFLFRNLNAEEVFMYIHSWKILLMCFLNIRALHWKATWYLGKITVPSAISIMCDIKKLKKYLLTWWAKTNDKVVQFSADFN